MGTKPDVDQDPPLCMVDVLAAEFATLRSGTDYAAANEKELFDKVHRQAEPFSALCISGGGIRSATFGLGAIQGLAYDTNPLPSVQCHLFLHLTLC